MGLPEYRRPDEIVNNIFYLFYASEAAADSYAAVPERGLRSSRPTTFYIAGWRASRRAPIESG